MAKRSKESVRYQDHPNGNKWCDLCRHFEPPDACTGVAGEISPRGYCIRFLREQQERSWYDKKD
jgi:hypothetical protein